MATTPVRRGLSSSPPQHGKRNRYRRATHRNVFCSLDAARKPPPVVKGSEAPMPVIDPLVKSLVLLGAVGVLACTGNIGDELTGVDPDTDPGPPVAGSGGAGGGAGGTGGTGGNPGTMPGPGPTLSW